MSSLVRSVELPTNCLQHRSSPSRETRAGRTAANSRIRADLERACRASGHRLYLPALSLCGDNGAMIGCQAYYEYQAGRRGDLALNAYATRSIEQG